MFKVISSKPSQLLSICNISESCSCLKVRTSRILWCIPEGNSRNRNVISFCVLCILVLGTTLPILQTFYITGWCLCNHHLSLKSSKHQTWNLSPALCCVWVRRVNLYFRVTDLNVFLIFWFVLLMPSWQLRKVKAWINIYSNISSVFQHLPLLRDVRPLTTVPTRPVTVKQHSPVWWEHARALLVTDLLLF